MADLLLTGPLDFHGVLTLQPDGGKVIAGGLEVLVEQATGIAPPFIFPPPPSGPIDNGQGVEIISSLNQTVKAGPKAIVTQGMCLQGDRKTWPGFVLPGSGNVTVNQIPMNVLNEQAVIFPSGGTAQFNNSGQS